MVGSRVFRPRLLPARTSSTSTHAWSPSRSSSARIFFTAASFGQLTDAIAVRHSHRGARPTSWKVWRWNVEPLDFWAAVVQFGGTLYFNVEHRASRSTRRSTSTRSIDSCGARTSSGRSRSSSPATSPRSPSRTGRGDGPTTDRPGWIAKLEPARFRRLRLLRDRRVHRSRRPPRSRTSASSTSAPSSVRSASSWERPSCCPRSDGPHGPRHA